MKLLRDNSGQAIIELALTLPFLLILFLGIAEFGHQFYVGIEVHNAALAGAEYGAQSRATASDFGGVNRGIETITYNEGLNLAPLDSNWTATGSDITVQQLCAGSYSITPPTASNCTSVTTNSVMYVQVNTQVTTPALFGIYGFAKAYTQHGHALVRVRD